MTNTLLVTLPEEISGLTLILNAMGLQMTQLSMDGCERSAMFIARGIEEGVYCRNTIVGVYSPRHTLEFRRSVGASEASETAQLVLVYPNENPEFSEKERVEEINSIAIAIADLNNGRISIIRDVPYGPLRPFFA